MAGAPALQAPRVRRRERFGGEPALSELFAHAPWPLEENEFALVLRNTDQSYAVILQHRAGRHKRQIVWDFSSPVMARSYMRNMNGTINAHRSFQISMDSSR